MPYKGSVVGEPSAVVHFWHATRIGLQQPPAVFYRNRNRYIYDNCCLFGVCSNPASVSMCVILKTCFRCLLAPHLARPHVGETMRLHENNASILPFMVVRYQTGLGMLGLC